MHFSPAESHSCKRLLDIALQEDLNSEGDITSQALLTADAAGLGVFRCRQTGIIAGIDAISLVADVIDRSLITELRQEDGESAPAGSAIATIHGPARGILAGERIILNFLQHLSGIATLTQRFVAAVRGTRARILDTRKTTPGWRLLEKYAVRCGGGTNHRLGLFDSILIKDNHLASLGGSAASLAQAVHAARRSSFCRGPLIVEVDNLIVLDEVLPLKPDVILLDNFSVADLRDAVKRRDSLASEVQMEASGGITLATVEAVACTGVDRISIGALTHSAPALDISLDFEAL